MVPYFRDGGVTLYHGDAATVLATMPAGTIDCVVTSPPYYGLRDYGEPGQLGLERTPTEYVAALVDLCRHLARVMTPAATLWLNIGDGYAMNAGSRQAPGATSTLAGRVPGQAMPSRPTTADRPPKNLLGIPWRVAFALQDDGWILRNAIVWHKPNGMPESVTDRLRCGYEVIFLLVRNPRYHFNLDAIRERPGAHPAGRNPGDVWSIATAGFPEAHYAVFPAELPRRCIAAGCPEGGVVLDPFSGSGTTGWVAERMGRRYVGIDLSREYLDMSLRTRLAQPALLVAEDLPAKDLQPANAMFGSIF